ncbi:MAG: DUF5915 domain-containing protein, partial [Chloroflexota bacterium]
TALVERPPFRTVFSYALMRDEQGEEMHKSKGNAIWFDDAAEVIGVDVMRWLFATTNPDANLNFGYHACDEVRRRFILPLWNSYSFLATYARLDGFTPGELSAIGYRLSVPGEATPPSPAERSDTPATPSVLDRWIISQLHRLIGDVRAALDRYAPDTAAKAIERFTVDELSNWYIRRNRRRFWKTEADRDKAAAYLTLHEVLVTLTKLLAPFIPFLADELYDNLGRSVQPEAPASVHLTDFPVPDPAKVDEALDREMAALLAAVGLGRAARTKASAKVRQPLPAVLVWARDPAVLDAVERMQDQLLDELNVKRFERVEQPELYASYDVRPNLPLLGPKYGRQVGAIRQALAAADAGDLARAVRAGASVTLEAGGERFELAPEELLVDVKEREGFNVAESRDLLVALDATLTPALIAEGLARDFVRGVQDARKEAGLRIEDTIRLLYAAAAEPAAAIEAHAEYIKGETLAPDLRSGNPTGEAHQAEVRLGKDRVRIGLTRVGSLLDNR